MTTPGSAICTSTQHALGDECDEAAPKKWRWLYFRKRFHEKIREGVKVNTLRNQRIPPGTMVACPVGLLEIVNVEKKTPRWVGSARWKEEGCSSMEDFFNEFKSIHPEPDVLDRPMWLHEFRLVVSA